MEFCIREKTTQVLRPALAVTFFAFLFGCAGAPIKEPTSSAEKDFEDIKYLVQEILDSREEEKPEGLKLNPKVSQLETKSEPKTGPYHLDAPEVKELPSEKEMQAPERSRIPVQVNQLVVKWMKFFTGRSKETFQQYLRRGANYRKDIERILKKYEIPQELYYLALIESGFSTRATSIKGAAGVWQFIRATGKRYGLKVGHYVDERRDVMRATEAAAKYLRDLHNIFHSWYLALAAYNAGEQRVLNAIFRAKSRDFWILVEKRVLPRETINYVPKFIAALILGQNSEKFEIEKVAAKAPSDIVLVDVPNSVKLRTISRYSPVSYQDLKKYNPHIRRGVTPPGRKGYQIWVPSQAQQAFEASVLQNRLARLKQKTPKRRSYSSKVSRVSKIGSRKAKSARTFHRVKRGENLSLIASRYGLTVNQLKRLNKMKADKIFPGKKLRVARQLKKYRVKRGENLTLIARRFGLSINQLKCLNGLKKNVIYVGQKLNVRRSL